MSRVFNPDSAGKERNQLRKKIVIAIRAFMSQQEPNQEAKDASAFIVIALRRIHGTVEQSVVAWEKRGYWVKADRFRLEWEWTLNMSNKLEQLLIQENWIEVAGTCVQIAQKFYNVNVSPNHRMGVPWTGSWKKLFS
ncbi:MAG: hypothetical protein JEZ00_03005 [Anaerolineaceae bacterium]|nr:hypothetical protein [Anaerolineaceae bacterium]